MFNNGSVSKNLKYEDICTSKKFLINIAYNIEPGWFEINKNSMVEWNNYFPIINEMSHLSFDYEILSIFFLNNNILVTWIDCNRTMGIYDYETGKWTGTVGKVKIGFLIK